MWVKHLRKDGTSLNGRYCYDLSPGAVNEVPGNGAYLSDGGRGIWRSKYDPEGIYVAFDSVAEPTGANAPDGVVCYRVVGEPRIIELDEAVCLAAVRQNGWALQCVPELLCTETVCLEAVRQYGRALEYVPEPLRTKAVCLAAVQQDGWALKYIPEPLCTKAMCI